MTYGQLECGDTLVSYDVEDGVWTVAWKSDSAVDPITITWLRLDTGEFQEVDFHPDMNVSSRYTLHKAST